MLLTILCVYCLVTWLIGASWVLEIQMTDWVDRLLALVSIIFAPIVVPTILIGWALHQYLS